MRGDGKINSGLAVAASKSQLMRSNPAENVRYWGVINQGELMKSSPGLVTHGFVSPPGEAMRDTITERRSAAHHSDPARYFHEPAGGHDSRRVVAASGAPQRVRARQTEARTAGLCHVRIRRRQEAVGC
jgi:hypothetical protein